MVKRNIITDKVLSVKTIGNVTIKTVQMYKNNVKDRITISEIKKILAQIKKQDAKLQVSIAVQNDDRTRTINVKGYRDEDVSAKELEDYYNGMAHDNENFFEFHKVIISLKRYN